MRVHNILEKCRRRLMSRDVEVDELLITRKERLRRDKYVKLLKHVLEREPP